MAFGPEHIGDLAPQSDRIVNRTLHQPADLAVEFASGRIHRGGFPHELPAGNLMDTCEMRRLIGYGARRHHRDHAEAEKHYKQAIRKNQAVGKHELDLMN